MNTSPVLDEAAFVHTPPSPDTRHDDVEFVLPNAGNPADSGSLNDLAQAVAPPILPRDESPPLNIEDELSDVSCAESPLLPDELPPNELPPDDRAQPDTDTAPSCINSIALSQQFISALHNASLNESGMDLESVEHLHNPPESSLVIDDPNLRLSLNIFLAIDHASNDTYKLVRDAII